MKHALHHTHLHTGRSMRSLAPSCSPEFLTYVKRKLATFRTLHPYTHTHKHTRARARLSPSPIRRLSDSSVSSVELEDVVLHRTPHYRTTNNNHHNINNHNNKTGNNKIDRNNSNHTSNPVVVCLDFTSEGIRGLNNNKTSTNNNNNIDNNNHISFGKNGHNDHNHNTHNNNNNNKHRNTNNNDVNDVVVTITQSSPQSIPISHISLSLSGTRSSSQTHIDTSNKRTHVQAHTHNTHTHTRILTEKAYNYYKQGTSAQRLSHTLTAIRHYTSAISILSSHTLTHTHRHTLFLALFRKAFCLDLLHRERETVSVYSEALSVCEKHRDRQRGCTHYNRGICYDKLKGNVFFARNKCWFHFLCCCFAINAHN